MKRWVALGWRPSRGSGLRIADSTTFLNNGRRSTDPEVRPYATRQQKHKEEEEGDDDDDDDGLEMEDQAIRTNIWRDTNTT